MLTLGSEYALRAMVHLRDAYQGFLRETTIYDVAVKHDNGKDGAPINNSKRKRR